MGGVGGRRKSTKKPEGVLCRVRKNDMKEKRDWDAMMTGSNEW